MKHIIILGDGMADWHNEALGGATLLQHAHTPNSDKLARMGRNGLLKTVADGFHPGSEVANSSILGYDQHIVYQGRGPLEAAAIGVRLEDGDFAYVYKKNNASLWLHPNEKFYPKNTVDADKCSVDTNFTDNS